jgi:hypothetical protein
MALSSRPFSCFAGIYPQTKLLPRPGFGDIFLGQEQQHSVMSLFENYDESYESVENDDKNRLFETHTKVERSVHDYAKVLIAVVVAVLLLGGAVVYFTMPGVGDEVRAPSGLEEAVKNHFLDNEKRAIEGATYFYCGEFYSARIDLEKRPDITARQFDAGSRRVVAVENANGSWQITSSSVVANTTFEPCAR